MPFMELLRMSIRSVRANLLRSILTLLVIAFGIMALVGILTAIDTMLFSISDNFSGLGANAFSVRPSSTVIKTRKGRQRKRGEPITLAQAMDLEERFEFPAQVAISIFGTSRASVKYADEKSNPNVAVRGVDEDYLGVNGLNLTMGRNFTHSDVTNSAPVAIIGKDIVKILFDDRETTALDKVISVGNIKYRVIGILESKGSNLDQSQDRQVIIPLLNAKRYYGTNRSNYSIKVGLRDATDMDEAISSTVGLFRSIRKLPIGKDNDFEIRKSDGLLDILKENTVYLRGAATGIGLITLLGAAIGLMNIMLVSVTERTREIGIRKAIGAKSRTILMQFLSEAIIICQMGGLVGIVLGIIVGNVVTIWVGGSFLIPWAWIVLGIVVCTAVGLLSGIYPALKASRLDPIESLRYE
ncbi:MAG: ABC transporter permease [Saprospiraceae bacterium]|nr:ABC transporter permease [Saprospiraceae bacterium]